MSGPAVCRYCASYLNFLSSLLSSVQAVRRAYIGQTKTFSARNDAAFCVINAMVGNPASAAFLGVEFKTSLMEQRVRIRQIGCTELDRGMH